MRIAFFLPNATFDLPGSPEVGGIETFAFTVGEALLDLGHEVRLYGGRPKSGRRHRETRLPLALHEYIETRSIPDLGTRFQRLVQRLHFGWKTREPWLAESFDWVLLFKPFDWPVAWYWKRRQPKLKVVMSFHGTDWFAGDRYFYSAVDTAFAVSPHVAGLAEKRIGTRPPVIPNPIDTDFFTPGDQAPLPGHSSTGATDAAPLRIIASGRLVGWKGFDVLVGAVAEARRAGADVRCELAGEGEAQAALERKIRELGASEAFRLLGRLDRVSLREKLRAADVYVAPSVGMEAFSIAAGEAYAVGLPLVLSDQIGLRDFLPAEDFTTVPARDASALAAEPIRRQKEPPTGTARARAARHARARERFAPATVAQRILELVAGDSALRAKGEVR